MYLPVIKTSSLLTRRAKIIISMIDETLSMEVMDSFDILFHDHGQFLAELLQLWIWSKNANIHKNPQGTKTSTVLWKHGVKSGSSVFQVRFMFQIGPAQNVVSVSIIYIGLLMKIAVNRYTMIFHSFSAFKTTEINSFSTDISSYLTSWLSNTYLFSNNWEKCWCLVQ